MKVSLLSQIAPENKLLNRLENEVTKAEWSFIAVSFIQKTGLKHLFRYLKEILNKGNSVAIFTSGYLRITDPEALEDLLKLTKTYDSLKVYFNPDDRFHSKFILFGKPKNKYSLFVGSSNISVGGLSETGELNIHIRGKKSDQIFKSIQIIVNDLKQNPAFKKIDKNLIDQYKTDFRKKSFKRIKQLKTTKLFKSKTISIPPLDTMPVCVIKMEFTRKEENNIKTKHKEWNDFMDSFPKFKKLKRGSNFLTISSIRKKRKMFNVSTFIEQDKIKNLGMIAHIKSGDEKPLSKLAKKLGCKEKDLIKKVFLDDYEIETLKRFFREAFA